MAVSNSINPSFQGSVQTATAAATPAGGSTALSFKLGALYIFVGSGAPTVTAAIGSLYMRTDPAGATSRLYVNTDGAATWTNVTCAA